MPENESFLRLYRVKRALDLNLKGAQLPKEQWTTPENVCIYNYAHNNQVVMFPLKECVISVLVLALPLYTVHAV